MKVIKRVILILMMIIIALTNFSVTADAKQKKYKVYIEDFVIEDVEDFSQCDCMSYNKRNYKADFFEEYRHVTFTNKSKYPVNNIRFRYEDPDNYYDEKYDAWFFGDFSTNTVFNTESFEPFKPNKKSNMFHYEKRDNDKLMLVEFYFYVKNDRYYVKYTVKENKYKVYRSNCNIDCKYLYSYKGKTKKCK